MPIKDTSVTETHIDVDGFSVRVKIEGEGPSVVILHGAGGISDAPGIKLLADGYRTFAIETPGFGESAFNGSSDSFRSLAATVSAVIDQLEIGDHSVVGTGVGARLALWHAIDAGEHVESIVLVSPAAILLDGVRAPTIPPSLLLRSVSTGQSSPIGLTSPTTAAQEEQIIKRIFGAGRDSELEKEMSTLDIPTLVLFGDEDYLIPPATGRLYREIMPKSFYILVHKAGPLIAHERPEAFASVVTDFLEWRDQFVYGHKTKVLNP
ncbi:alpha/beta fold hydrolase [Subtercola sp. YIM 133946]|uniref:alpha/beta fold hydrolase n=1 Tax=Subtercola sp. YIM 133946 TaxID=3118909 RepID=UPI002F930F35